MVDGWFNASWTMVYVLYNVFCFIWRFIVNIMVYGWFTASWLTVYGIMVYG